MSECTRAQAAMSVESLTPSVDQLRSIAHNRAYIALLLRVRSAPAMQKALCDNASGDCINIQPHFYITSLHNWITYNIWENINA